jgi:hypothetical protein
MSVSFVLVGSQIKRFKHVVKSLAAIGGWPACGQQQQQQQIQTQLLLRDWVLTVSPLITGSELLVEALPEKVSEASFFLPGLHLLQFPHPHLLPCLALQLILRAINSAHSAFLAVSLSSHFFESYNVFSQAGVVQAGILIKVCASV